ncbi:MAG: DNA cytosine methyltransferase [Burkholderiaceae bacterium]
MRFLSVCSGIEAASVAWQPLGWRAAAFSEIEPFPCALLAHHYPGVPNHGDMTKFKDWPDHAIDLLCGGTPCQSFSVAGLRKGLDDPRGNLMLTFGAIAAKYRPRWLVWENVPGVLSSNGGRDFGAFIGMLVQLGYGAAYRILDAQYFGVAQRRRRVFVVGCFGDWRSAAAVLFERHSLQGHPAPRRRTGQGSTRGVEFGPGGGSFTDLNPTLDSRAKDGPIRNQLAGAVFQPAPHAAASHGALPTVAAFKGGQGSAAGGIGYSEHLAPTLSSADSGSNRTPALLTAMQVRRLTPLECERLMGFPDHYTAVPTWKGWRKMDAGETPESCIAEGLEVRQNKKTGRWRVRDVDGPRYKALGNSWAVPCAEWIGQRIQAVEQITRAQPAIKNEPQRIAA